jgi:hypothetical protein
MMKRLLDSTSFIFIEGIMGSGKTTTAEWLTGQLRQQGFDARFLAEGPTASHPDHPLRVSADLAHPLAVWRDVSVEEYIDRSLGKWRQFARESRREAAVTICDGLLFHGNMADLLLMDATPKALHGYVTRVIDTLREHAPILIYSRQPDVARALRAVCDDRGSAWESYQVEWKVNSSPYGVARGLRGFAGLAALYRDYCALCDDIFANLVLPKLAHRQVGDWATYRRAISSFLTAPATTTRPVAVVGGDR